MAVHTLVDTMNGPSARPNVVVLDCTYQEDIDALKEKPLNAAEDLWLSTVDGRYSSPPIPVRVGSLHNMQTFYVHRDVLVKAQWFRKALCGGFREADEQVIDLPEEDPAIFHFLVAFLYEDRFHPIMPAANALEPTPDKGKGRDIEPETPDGSDSGSSSSSSSSSHNSDTSGIRWQQRNRRTRGAVDGGAGPSREKHPGMHRPGCHCPQCTLRHDNSRCWQCGARRLRSNNHPQPPGGRGLLPHQQRPGMTVNMTQPLPANAPSYHIRGEDMQTWLMAYELNLDVYICANRYLMDGFRTAVMRSCIDMLETAGTDAAHPQVLRLCQKLFDGVPERDPLLKMVLARVGFLQPMLWKRAPEETTQFLVESPELAAAILRETVMRHEATSSRPDLPSMENS
ncbi:hypothetical protein G7Z17_g10153 [Cylindrodendrum hubeiense]|uniref:BTB domain-containing protein n=1 Tax=Cylindrodendrum hubeiense TaxID=595255 RepID=A0A9P5GZ75_9HYPO|nr:hypothetical protein G7Z17_g10153 [Cylindrodendrum hubeiense]